MFRGFSLIRRKRIFSKLTVLSLVSSLVASALAAPVFGASAQTGAVQSDFAEAPGGSVDISNRFNRIGDSYVDNTLRNVLVTTPDVVERQSVSWYLEKMDLHNAISIETKVYLDHSVQKKTTEAPADGIAFIMQNDPRGVKATASNGEGLSIYGADYVKNALAIEIDTYGNYESSPKASNDPRDASGKITHSAVVVPAAVVRAEDHQNVKFYPDFGKKWVTFNIKWDPAQNDAFTSPVLGGLLTYTIGTETNAYKIDDVEKVFGATSVWVGFSGATGSQTSLNAIAFMDLPIQEPEPSAPPVKPSEGPPPVEPSEEPPVEPSEEPPVEPSEEPPVEPSPSEEPPVAPSEEPPVEPSPTPKPTLAPTATPKPSPTPRPSKEPVIKQRKVVIFYFKDSVNSFRNRIGEEVRFQDYDSNAAIDVDLDKFKPADPGYQSGVILNKTLSADFITINVVYLPVAN